MAVYGLKNGTKILVIATGCFWKRRPYIRYAFWETKQKKILQICVVGSFTFACDDFCWEGKHLV